jgi:hypothetical protein
MKYKYKNISGVALSLPEIGTVEAGAVVETDKEINNSNFEKVEENKTAEKSKDKKDEKQK